ncbi:uncharacterized protein LOC106179176 [Lingula anatina]|uniref:Uncharacterized protein LOC106179176 n=1 Tax=Lingula anatina TaxID=7574 RepID=A0A1S3K6V9_LINAN|nr:uncharacterized protein LOC106179176 [Lingula anatina]|eukprot:XP_013418164.1 uncharacterized protein LOC106179176 [Lingula anatina]
MARKYIKVALIAIIVVDLLYLKHTKIKGVAMNNLYSAEPMTRRISAITQRFPAIISTMVSEKEWEKIGCVSLKVHPNISTPICIYNMTEGDPLSNMLSRGTLWQPQLVKEMIEILKRDPELQLIDLGANLGTWTLSAARLGRKVLAAEMFPPTVIRLYKSIKIGNLLDLVTLVPKALSDIKENVTIYLCGNNKMGTNIVKNAKVMRNCGLASPYVANTITMDDLTAYLPNGLKKAFMKIDIEEMELRVFNRSEHFLKTVDIPIILMEWMHYRRSIQEPKCSYFISYMSRMGYIPFRHLAGPDGKLGPLLEDKHWLQVGDLYLIKKTYLESNFAHLQ